MDAVYSWVKNIIYYMIFLSVINNLLADSKYEKYIRFFAGMVLILLVVSPLTGRLRLDGQISAMFQSISLYNDAADLKSRMWEMDDRRLERMMGRYEEAVEQDVTAMAKAQGLTCVNASVNIDGDRNSSTYGQVTDIKMELKNEEGGLGAGEEYTGSRPVNVEGGKVGSIMVEPVEMEKGRGDDNDTEASGNNAPSSVSENRAGNERMNHLRGKVAEYYGIEESHIQVQWEND